MSALSSLLVQDQIVSVSTIEEALQRQVIFGGQLDTNLLELRAVDEQLLVAYKARVANMDPALREELDNVDLQAIRSVPRDIAEQYSFVPLRRIDRKLRVAVCQPPSDTALEEAASLLGLILEPLMTSELRLRVALNRCYGLELPSRFSRLAGMLATALPAHVQTRQVTVPTVQPYPHGRAGRFEVGRALSEQGAPMPVVTAVQERRSVYSQDDGFRQEPSGELGDPTLDLRDTYPGMLTLPSQGGYQRPPTILPLSAGLELIERATTPEEVFGAALRVIGGMVEYSAVFTVKGRAAFGKAAYGQGTSSEELSRRPVLLEKPGALWTVTQTRAHYLGPLPPSRANDGLLEAIGRSRPATVIVVPVVIRDRTILLVYADSGPRRAIGYELAALLPLASAMGSTFERLILERKRGQLFSTEPPLPPPEEDLNARRDLVPPRTELLSAPRTLQRPVVEIGGSASTGTQALAKARSRRAPSGASSGEAPTSTHGSGGFVRENRPTPLPFNERFTPPTPEPGSRTGDGVLILLTEVLGDPQERTWNEPPRGPGGTAGPPREMNEPQYLRGTGWTPPSIPVQQLRTTLLFGERQRSASQLPGAPQLPPGGTTVQPEGAELRPPEGEVSDVLLVSLEPGRDADTRAGVKPRMVEIPPSALPAKLTDVFASPFAMKTNRGSDPGSPAELPRGLPDPNCLATAIEPASVELMPGPAFLAALEVSGLEELDPFAEPEPAPSSRTFRSSGAPFTSPHPTPLEQAIAAAMPAVEPRTESVILVEPGAPIEPESALDISVDEDIIEITLMPPSRDRLARLPDSASASGESRVRASVAGVEIDTDEPSVIVDMGDDIEELVSVALSAGPSAEAAVVELLGVGEAVIPSLVRRFPGEVLLDWEGLSLPVPEPRSHGPLLALLQRFGEPVVPYIIPKLNSAERSKRFYAVLLLGAVGGDEALLAIGPRMLDYDARIATLASSLIAADGPRGELAGSIRNMVRAKLSDRHSTDVLVHRAIEAVGALRDVEAVVQLIEQLKISRGARRQAALQSLRLITGQDFGNSARHWASWWSRAKVQRREEWLIEALDARQEPVRARAAAELARVVSRDFGFSAAAPRRERDEARRRYIEWWQTEGKSAAAERD